MKILHVACLPFPSAQGTQAAIDSMLRASTALGHDAHLLCYAHGSEAPLPPVSIHRLRDFPRVRSLRSGPTLGKLALDAQAVLRLRRCVGEMRPDAIVAHHVEAAAAAIASRVGPVHYLAHTSLRDELPTYFPRLPSRSIAELGRALEHGIGHRCEAVAAVSPALATRLGETSYLPIPWSIAPARGPTRFDARLSLRIEQDVPLCLYAGNLDRYQGWERLLPALHALRRMHPRAALLFATESAREPAVARARANGLVEAVHFASIAGEHARRVAHAAADVAWVPRRAPGGAPVKLLEALARSVPVVTTTRATGGLPVERACAIVHNDDAQAIAEATETLLASASLRDHQRDEGRKYLAQHHGIAAFARALHAWIGPPSTPRPTRSRQPRPASVARRAC